MLTYILLYQIQTLNESAALIPYGKYALLCTTKNCLVQTQQADAVSDAAHTEIVVDVT